MSVVKRHCLSKHECYCHCNVDYRSHSLTRFTSDSHFYGIVVIEFTSEIKDPYIFRCERGTSEDERLQRTIHFYSFLSQAFDKIGPCGNFSDIGLVYSVCVLWCWSFSFHEQWLMNIGIEILHTLSFESVKRAFLLDRTILECISWCVT